MTKSKSLRAMFYAAFVFSVLGFGFGMYAFLCRQLGEGVLIIGLSFIIFGVAGIFVTPSVDEDVILMENLAADKTAEDIVRFHVVAKIPGDEEEPCDLVFRASEFLLDNGEQVVTTSYDNIRSVELKTPVLVVTHNDSSVWHVRFDKFMQTKEAYDVFQEHIA